MALQAGMIGFGSLGLAMAEGLIAAVVEFLVGNKP
jgi:hypothetical protein